jgi:hypothetical protein
MINLIKDALIEGFIMKLVEGEKLNNWEIQDILIVLKI